MNHIDGGVHQVAGNRVDIAPDIADLRELSRLDLDERRVGQLRQTASDLGLAHAGWSDHEDVLGHDLGALVLGEREAAVAVAHGDGDGALGVVLPDDVAIQLADDLLRRQVLHALRSCLRDGEYNGQCR